MTSPRRTVVVPSRGAGAAGVLLAIAILVGACSGDDGASGDATTIPLGTVAPVSTGDECFDPAGDMIIEDGGGERVVDEPAGVDLVRAAASREDTDLLVVFETVAPIESAPDPTFYVWHGDLMQSPTRSFELRFERLGDRWVAKLVTIPQLGQEKTDQLPAVPAVAGNRLEARIAIADLPALTSRLWSFGSSAGVSARNRVVDECLPFLSEEPEGGTTTSRLPSPTTNMAAPVEGSVGDRLVGPDGSAVTVREVQVPATPDNPDAAPAITGAQFVAASVEVCATDRPLSGVGESRFLVTPSGGTTIGVWDGPNPPHLDRLPLETSLRPGECIEGWVTFQIAFDEDVASVAYDTSGSGVGPLLVFAR